MKLILWDIDGTLICSGQAGEGALVDAMKNSFGVEASLDEVDYRGRTDVLIGHMLLKHYQIEFTEKNLKRFLDEYLRLLALELHRREGKVHPGVLEILKHIESSGNIEQGLLTGNLRRGAELKLSHYGLWDYFSFGVFSDDGHERNDLSPIALLRGEEKIGEKADLENVYVIGDTPHDIECGKIIGAKTIAVATGSHPREELTGATHFFSDLGDVDEFLKIL